LHLSSSNVTGYMGVTEPSSGRFRAQHRAGGRQVSLGTFDTAVEAAVAYARVVGQAEVAGAGGPVWVAAAAAEGAEGAPEEEEAAEAAGTAAVSAAAPLATEAEGLRLHLSSSSTGYKNVWRRASGRFWAKHSVDGRQDTIGTFATAVEAAVAYARTVGEYQPPAPPTVVAEAEGLRLHLSSSSSTGYKGVRADRSRYKAQRSVGGREVYLGSFDTAVEAAVAYARAGGESEGPQEEPGRADPATDPEPAPPPPSAPVPPPPPASTSASAPSAAASAPPEFSVAMRDELLSLPRHRRARRFFTRALREQDELLELYDRREARGGVLHPEAQRRFEQLKAAKAAAARSSSSPADTFSASLGAVAPQARRDSTRIPHFLVSAPVGYHDTPSWVAEAPAWVLAAAAAERLTLVRSTNTTGFAHVLLPAGANKATPFMLRCAMEEGGARVVGYYASAAEAALVYARRVGPEASAHEHRMGGARLMTAAQALAAAEAEGLTLERPHHNSRRKEARFKYVHLDQDAASRARPYRLVIRGEDKRLLKGGRYATEEQAALEAARYHAACARKN